MSSNTPKFDYVAKAIEVGLKLNKVKEKCPSKQGESPVRGFIARAKDFPSLVVSNGLVPALTFYLSKVEWARGADNKEVFTGCLDGEYDEKKTCEKLSGTAYDCYLHVVLVNLKDVLPLALGENAQELLECNYIDDKNKNAVVKESVLKCLKGLMKYSGRLQTYFLPFLVELKKVSEIVK